jgi:hypothetical protein
VNRNRFVLLQLLQQSFASTTAVNKSLLATTTTLFFKNVLIFLLQLLQTNLWFYESRIIFLGLKQLLQQASARNFWNVFFASTTLSTVMALLLQLLQTNLLLATLSTSFFFFLASFQILLFLQTVKNVLLQNYHQISKQKNFSIFVFCKKHT